MNTTATKRGRSSDLAIDDAPVFKGGIASSSSSTSIQTSVGSVTTLKTTKKSITSERTKIEIGATRTDGESSNSPDYSRPEGAREQAKQILEFKTDYCRATPDKQKVLLDIGDKRLQGGRVLYDHV